MYILPKNHFSSAYQDNTITNVSYTYVDVIDSQMDVDIFMVTYNAVNFVIKAFSSQGKFVV